jgi:hypothetical protein
MTVKAPIGKNHALMLEWDWNSNKTFDPSTLTQGSSEKVSWICEKYNDHKWETAIYNRVKHGSGCPYCAGQRATKTNNLAVLNPKLSKEWHPTLNGSSQPKDFMAGSNRKVWWLCHLNKKHAWQAIISNRSKGRGCPYCSFKKLHSTNNLLATHPSLSDEWHPTLNDDLQPKDVMHGTAKAVWWQCMDFSDHCWKAQIRHRSKRNIGCPLCSGHKVSSTNNLAYQRPDLIEEWHPTLNGNLDPAKLVAGAARSVWWICKHSHVWSATCDSRVSAGTNCPKCTSQTSAPEIRLLSELRWLFPSIESRFKIDGKELDVYLPDHEIGIEYDGSHWHAGKRSKDQEKNQHFAERGITLLRVRESPLTPIGPSDIIVESRELNKETMNALVAEIVSLTDDGAINVDAYIALEGFANEALYNKYLSYLPDPFPEDSLEVMSPELTPQWHYEKNSPLVPKNFTNSSNKKVWWKCSQNSKHEWEQSINSRTSVMHLGTCPFCERRRVAYDNNLLVTHPLIAEEWHQTKNGDLSPADILSGYGEKVWWQCRVNSKHEWETAPTNRTSQSTKCPFCSGRRCIPEESIVATHPNIANEFSVEKNNDIRPEGLVAGSNKKIWWCCSSCNHAYEMRVQTRTRYNSGCKVCKSNLR